MTEDYTTEDKILNEGKAQNVEKLLLVFPPSELRQFYADHSQQMLLTTSAEIERHEALKELLEILSKN